MAEITAQMVKELRERTGAGVKEAKDTLVQTSGDMKQAIELLREKGLKVSDKVQGREAKEGRIEIYVHPGARMAAMVELDCETDFVARTDDFIALAKDLAMQIAASKPVSLDRTGVPADLIEKERSIASQKAAESGKPAEIVAKMVEGTVQKYLKEVTLLGQPFVKDDKQTVEQLLKARGAKVHAFTLYVVGEGIEKKQTDFAAEVAAQAAAAAAR